MPEEKEAPRPHGHNLGEAAGKPNSNSEDNHAQVRDDAQPDATGGIGRGREDTDRDEGRGSTSNGVPASDEDDGALRKRQYKNGAELVSGID